AGKGISSPGRHWAWMLKSAAFVSYGSDQKQWDSSGFNSGIFLFRMLSAGFLTAVPATEYQNPAVNP
ncbi:MAG: hypothetical protein KKH95_02370, partial [Gammaproteobacteria bacterium]|nr:hypothetical protein [Gammaproteobacteria bacterium]